MERVAQYDLAKLRADVRDLEDELDLVDRFEAAWKDYTDKLERLVQDADGQPDFKAEPTLGARLSIAEETRIEAYSLRRGLGGHSNDHFSNLLEPNLRTRRNEIVSAVSHTMPGPTARTFISLNHLYGAMGECRAVIQVRREELHAGLRKRKALLEEAERAVEEEHKRQLELAQAAAPPLGQQLRATIPGRLLAWAFEGKLKSVVSGVILVLLALAGLAVLDVILPFIRRMLGSLLPR